MSTGELVASLHQHYQNVTGICFTADGSRFISGGAEGLVLVWSLETAMLNQSNANSVRKNVPAMCYVFHHDVNSFFFLPLFYAGLRTRIDMV